MGLINDAYRWLQALVETLLDRRILTQFPAEIGANKVGYRHGSEPVDLPISLMAGIAWLLCFALRRLLIKGADGQRD